ncbi:EAL domain-containing protein [Sphingomonas sp. PL-96]|uniref:putative bifunctional diguanylate cyclase/phosphodiesterase n=1 Tax=Sphingomonas sp. PL-96 TaxID=2887201 RepID=UPI001E58692D|nr:EAL domain-containing protein [Sphingomonas sp. PL-96]MCC2976175.1 EAL domain-containing protein [Sphingomonas sp. PL-96]
MSSRPPFTRILGTRRPTRLRLPSEAVLLGVGIASTLLLVGVGSLVAAETLEGWFGSGPAPDGLHVAALLLNLALLLLAWSRHKAQRDATRADAAAERHARALAAPDPLQILLDRTTFASEGAALVAHAERSRGAVALLLLDLDHFKAVNDMHGKAAGDAMLREVAAAMLETMPPGTQVARTGGDAFACMLPVDPRRPDQVDRLAERLLARLSRPMDLGGVPGQVTASMGVARSGPDCRTVKALMRAADIALGSAKRAGRDRAVTFDRSMERELHSRNDVEEALRIAIPRGQILPFFDQQIDLSTGDLDGFEVLPRWQHPVRGVLDAESFLPIAEDTGLIAELSLCLMRHGFEAARDWDPSLSLSFNLSRRQLRDAWLAQKILKLLTETGFPAHRLQVEITEGALFDNLPLAQSIIGSLKNQGVCIALDGFGTGFSSLAHLRALPLDRIKIDARLVGAMAEDADAAAIVTAICRLGESLNLPVTAQGVPDATTEGRLRALGCAKAQGLRYGPPLSTAAVRQMLAERRQLVPRPEFDIGPPPPLGITSPRLVG